ncbi:hypothetical protein DKG75_14615 [Zavarzinia compransoris]|uniref:Lipocalin-like domain-containing protein n=2 Tax=Zavarzinia compransoris TaxID=1264899 RepID=A0A317DY80_9PROT|nr:hypothetical protein DKG75_14615 [Zavarzinia compransoris]
MFAALGLALLASTGPASADQRVEGRWSLDVEATVAAARESGVPPEGIAQMQQELAPMAKGFFMTFKGKRLEVVAGPDTTNCDWTWGKYDIVLPSKCLDQTGKPNDLDPEREAIAMVDGRLHLLDKPSKLSLILQRQ